MGHHTASLMVSLSYSLFNLRQPGSPLILSEEPGFLRMNSLVGEKETASRTRFKDLMYKATCFKQTIDLSKTSSRLSPIFLYAVARCFHVKPALLDICWPVLGCFSNQNDFEFESRSEAEREMDQTGHHAPAVLAEIRH